MFSQISEVYPEITPIDRTTTAAWSDPNLRAAVVETGREKLIMAGLWTEVCLVQTVLPALKEGFDVYFVSDCSGGVSKEAHEDAKARMIQAGAKPITWMALLCEWTPDYTSPERARLNDVVLQQGGGSFTNSPVHVGPALRRLVPTQWATSQPPASSRTAPVTMYS